MDFADRARLNVAGGYVTEIRFTCINARNALRRGIAFNLVELDIAGGWLVRHGASSTERIGLDQGSGGSSVWVIVAKDWGDMRDGQDEEGVMVSGLRLWRESVIRDDASLIFPFAMSDQICGGVSEVMAVAS